DTGGGGLKEVIAMIEGRGAYSRLKYESGVHRVQRVPATEASGRIHTSTATVAVLPEAEEVDVQINEKDLRIDTFCSSGPGGQSVNTTYSAVRLTHLPTGVVATCQNERSQHQNREMAMTVLRARLLQIQLQKQAETVSKLKGEYVPAAWGNQIRSYVVHPYKLVKDHRTDVESTSPDAVLDGDLDPFIRAYLRSTVGAGG
ncbi:MAG: peptide chain release factor-like protein, partial [Dehalococcoidia bacterium]|nr:peptide chain release factor-like protein [Dehalococcoidia bacterium]